MAVIKGKINVKRIVKEKLFKGEKGTYLDIVIIRTPNSPHNDYMIVQDTDKDEDTIFLGGANDFPKNEPTVAATGEASGDDLPF